MKNAFQQHKGSGDPQESVSIQPPPTPGWSSPRNPNLVCKLKKAIYGSICFDWLKQAPRAKKGACLKKFSSFLTAWFWIKGSGYSGTVRILTFCLSTSWSLPHPSFIRWRQHSHREWFFSFIRFHQGAWQPIFLFHPLYYFLGMEVSRSTSELRLTQTKYTQKWNSYLVETALRYAYISRCQAIRPYSYKKKAGCPDDRHSTSGFCSWSESHFLER